MGDVRRHHRGGDRRALPDPRGRRRRRFLQHLTATDSTVTQPAATGAAAGRRGLLSFTAVTCGALLGLTTLAAVDPNRAGHYPTCPFLAVTGHYCPGCGSLRAVHDALHGDVHSALARNPLAVILAPLVVFAYVCWGLRLLGYHAPHPTRIAAGWIWALLAVVLAYWVLRNVPGWTWLSPA